MGLIKGDTRSLDYSSLGWVHFYGCALQAVDDALGLYPVHRMVEYPYEGGFPYLKALNP